MLLATNFHSLAFINIPPPTVDKGCHPLHSSSHLHYGPIHNSKKVVHLDKFSVITDTLQVRMVCHDLTNFGRSRQIFQRTTDKFVLGKNWTKSFK